MSTKIPIYEAKIRNTDNTGIFAMSFVEIPANETNFVALKKAPAIVKMKMDTHKQILTGVVLIPDQLIYRNDDARGEYYLKFTAQDIELIRDKMMRQGIALSTTTHQHESDLTGNYLTELWIVEDPKRDKAVALGLGELPKGTLVASYKITNAAYWRNEVLAGNVKGFSIEGLFNFKNVNMKKTTTTAADAAAKTGVKGNRVATFLNQVAAFLEGDTAADAKDVADEAKKDETDSGTPVIIFTLADSGGEIWVDAEGYATLGGTEPMAPGEHALADGNVIVIDDEGMLVVTQPEADGGAEPAAAAAALAKAKAAGAAFLKAQGDPKAAKIALLEKQLAELKKAPSTKPAAQKVTGAVELSAEEVAKLSPTQRAAYAIKMARARQDGDKK